ncbi:AsmA family protein [Aurantibacillus circumpalustris]|uniref:AsmA family protein n=1 Tax=Aurantibacillus circumpalustris TaxID=3036359 RepID=UPI0037BF8025
MILLILAGGTVFVIITFYKKELTALLVDNLKTNYGLTLQVKDIRVSFFDNWPQASVKLKDVFIANELTGKNEPLLKAGSLSLSFNLKKMLNKEFIVKYISISDAEVLLVRNENGTKNFEFKKQAIDTSKHSPISFGLNKVAIKNVKFKFVNKERAQNISINFMDVDIRLKQYAEGLKATVNGKTLVEELLFNPEKGAFLKNTRTTLNLDVNYLFETKTICIHPPSFVEIENHPYNVTSLINFGEEKKLALQIESKKIKYERVITLLNPKMRKMLQNFEVKRPVDAKILLVVNIGKREEPVIIAEVVGENCDLLIGNSKIPYSELDFRGRIRSIDSTKQKGDAEHASVIFEPIKGKVYDFPFTASVSVTNLVQPYIDIKANLLIEANKIPYEVSKAFVLKGSANARLSYSGPTNKLNSKEFLQSPMNLGAVLTFKNLSYKELDRPYVYTINGQSQLNNRDMEFDNLSVITDIANANVKGKVEGFVLYIFGFTKKFKATISARTDMLTLDPLFVTREEVKKPQTKESKNNKEKMSESQFEFDVSLFAKHLLFRKVEANNADVALFYKDNSLDVKSLSVNTCDGTIKGKANIKNFNKLDADIAIEDVNVNKLFTQFENFGQEAVVASNLKGNISLNGNFKTELDNNMNLKPETMLGDVKLKLTNGHLINFEPVQNLSNFLFRNRDFNDVTFSELNEKFKLKGYEMQIDELEIASNVLNLFVVDGLYNFNGNSNMNILVPWSNLKRRGKNYVPKSTGQSAENTKGLKLNFNGPSKKMKISLGHKEHNKK